MKKYILIAFILVTSFQTWAQNVVTVSGKVSDSDNREIIGAGVLLEGTGIGVTTDMDGKYEIRIPADKLETGVLSVSCIGFVTSKIRIEERSLIDIILEEDNMLLDETVVIGYGSMKKSDLTGAVTSVRIDEQIASQSNTLDQLLLGKAAGVQIMSNSASPDAGVQIRVRGANSFNGQNEPLYVVDGIIVNASSVSLPGLTHGADNAASDEEVNGLMGINPQDIASIEILKDASATAIYGSQGANGVILITTKTAKDSKPTIRFSIGSDVGIRNKKMDMLSFEEYVSYVDALHAAAPDVLDDSGYNSLMKKLYIDPQTRTELKVKPIDWQEHVMRTAVNQRYHLSLSGKPKSFSYNLSIGYNSTQGIIKTTDVEQYTVRFNAEKAFVDKFKLGLRADFAYINSNLTQGASGRMTSGASFMRSMLMTRPWTYLSEEDDESNADDYVSGPDKWLKDFVSKRNHFKSGINLYAEWNILPWLMFKSVGGINSSNLKMSKFKSMRISRNTGSVASVSDADNIMWTWDNMFMANKSFGQHHLSGTLGFSVSDNRTTSQHVEGWDITQYHAQVSSINTAETSDMSFSKSRNSLVSGFIRVIYNYRDRYILTATYRLDGSSRFRGANKWASFPSFAFAWRINQERWFNCESISQLKFRAGWGMVGNQAISNYQTFSNYSNGKLANHTAGGPGYALTLYASNIANPDLKWETTEQYNIGLDIGMFKGRLSFSMDLYDKTTKDLLQRKTIALSSGYDTIWMNQGAIRNRGLEMVVDAVPVVTDDFEWTLGGNISFNRNQIVSIGEAGSRGKIYVSKGKAVETGYFLGQEMTSTAGTTINIFMEGYPMGLFYAYKVNGIIPEGKTGPGFEKDKPLGPGHFMYEDVDGNGYIDSNDRTIIGDPNPDFTFGFNTSLRYRRLTLSLSFNGSYGNDVFNLNNDSEYDVGKYTYNIRRKAYYNAWTKDNQDTVYPALGAISGGDRTHYRSTCVEDASYIRLSNVSLSYNIPLKKNKAIRGINIGLSGRNLLIFTKYSGWDPDVNSFGSNMMRMGIDLNSYPQARSFGVDLKFTF